MRPKRKEPHVQAGTQLKRKYMSALRIRALFSSALAWGAAALALPAYAEEPSEQAPSTGVPYQSKSERQESDEKERNFYEVLEDVMADFEYDLKNGEVVGLKDISIKNIATSENVPPSFKSHLELLITERVLRTTKTRVLQCLPCRAKKTTLQGNQVVISSPETNPVELSRIAKVAGIESFMDIAFAYQSNGIILSMTITHPETGAVLWSRSYNSETSRASAFRRGVDYSQIDDARRSTEYQPYVQYRAIVYYLFEPNVGGTTGVIGAGFRMVERYDNRKREVGFELNFLKDSSTIVASSVADATTVNLYSGLNLGLLFVHAWNLIGDEENFNRPRGSFMLGIGGTYASGFLGGLVRGQYEWRLGKHYAVSATLGYRPPATAFLNTTPVESVSGAEFGLGVNFLF